MYKTLQEHRFSFIFEIVFALCAALGAIFFIVFFGMKFGLFNVRGSIDERNQFFDRAKATFHQGANPEAEDVRTISEEWQAENLYTVALLQNALRDNLAKIRKQAFPDKKFTWIQSSEWQTLSAALIKDKDVIKKASNTAGISPRLLVSVVIAEQMRFFTSDRESFKKFFEPLKILGSLSQFSLGVSGVKPETAELIEDHLKDSSSPYYLGKSYEHLLEATSTTIGDLRFARLTDARDHYYSYLYTALFVRQIIEQWNRAGFDIQYRPEIIATIFNLGFEKSDPKPNPQVAGSSVVVEGETYTFGGLAYEFYYSGELMGVFGY